MMVDQENIDSQRGNGNSTPHTPDVKGQFCPTEFVLLQELGRGAISLSFQLFVISGLGVVIEGQRQRVGHPHLHTEFSAILGYMRPSLNS